MANILYRGSAVPSATNSAGANNAPLTNDQIDKNLYALDLAKFEKSGGTVTGDTTFNTNVTVTGNLVVNGITTNINSTTLTVDDKNIELGSAIALSSLSGTIITSATTSAITMTSVVGLIPGMVLTKVSGAGVLGTTATIISIDSSTQITVTASTSNTLGALVFNAGGVTDVTANGGGITLKGATDKTIIWDNTNTNWTSSENWNIPTSKVFKINNVSVLSATTLGSAVVNSSLTKLGTTAGFVKSDASGNLTSDTTTYLVGSNVHYIGTTSIALNRASGAQTLSGVSIDGNAATVTTNANLSGDVTSSGNVTTLANTAVTAGSYGSSTSIPSITIDSKGRITAASGNAISVGDGALTISAIAAATTNNTVTLALSGAYSANTSTARTLDLKVGPALTNLATLMTTAGAGFIKRGATADTYTIDTNTYLTSYTESDTLATVTGRGATTATASTFSGGLTASGGLTGTTGTFSQGLFTTAVTEATALNIINSSTDNTQQSTILIERTATPTVTGATWNAGRIRFQAKAFNGSSKKLVDISASTIVDNTNLGGIVNGMLYINTFGADSTGTQTGGVSLILGNGNFTIQDGAGTNYHQFRSNVYSPASDLGSSLGSSALRFNALYANTGTFSSTISASNFSGSHSGTSSGTNTGDQTLPTTLPHNGTALSATTGTFSSTITAPYVTVSGGLGTLGMFKGSNTSGIAMQSSDSSASVYRLLFLDYRNELGTPVVNNAVDINTNGSAEWSVSVTPAGARTSDRRISGIRVNSDGSLTAAGNITAYSDIKLKENIATIDSALDTTLKLRGVYYTRKDMSDNARKVGVIAQEIQEVLPEVVKSVSDKNGDTTLSVDYGNITALLIEAIKELNAKVEDLQNQLANK